VVVALPDPNPQVKGGGRRALSRAGVAVLRAGAGQARAAARQNEKFLTWSKKGRPFVLAKWAATMDGRIAAAEGRSRWISGRQSRRRALLLREEYDAVLVGAGTVRMDDPRLTRRLGKNLGGAHHRIVLDGRLSLPLWARLIRQPEGLIVATARPPGHPKARRLAARGVQVWSLPQGRSGRVSIPRLLRRLARHGVTSLMVEGGAATLWSFFSAGAVDRVCAFLAPRVLGGSRAPAAVGGRGFTLGSAPWIEDLALERLGDDLLVTGRVARRRS
jgi:diaminohydroxyphosphoribosylaminopyrimidine deaminase/5-amino-6-(5-phosphoribosylamino)uracil reductase